MPKLTYYEKNRKWFLPKVGYLQLNEIEQMILEGEDFACDNEESFRTMLLTIISRQESERKTPIGELIARIRKKSE